MGTFQCTEDPRLNLQLGVSFVFRLIPAYPSHLVATARSHQHPGLATRFLVSHQHQAGLVPMHCHALKLGLCMFMYFKKEASWPWLGRLVDYFPSSRGSERLGGLPIYTLNYIRTGLAYLHGRLKAPRHGAGEIIFQSSRSC